MPMIVHAKVSAYTHLRTWREEGCLQLVERLVCHTKQMPVRLRYEKTSSEFTISALLLAPASVAQAQVFFGIRIGHRYQNTERTSASAESLTPEGVFLASHDT